MRALLIGVGEPASELIHDIRTHESQITLVGVIEPRVATTNLEAEAETAIFEGLPICGGVADVPRLIEAEQIALIIITLSPIEREVFEILLDQTPPGKVIWKILPNTLYKPELKLRYAHLVPLAASDLIGRREMSIDVTYLQEILRDKTVLVTGAGGSIGSELVKNLLDYPVKRVLALARSEYSLCTLAELMEAEHPRVRSAEKLHMFIANVKDYPRLRELAEQYSIDIILHAAAHKHVPLMERNEKEAIKNNVFATQNLLKLAHEKNIRSFVFISTDKAVLPKSIMGASKKLAEQLIRKHEDVFPFYSSIVRLGNVIGSRGSVIPLFNKQIRSGGPVTVTHPETKRYFMTMTEAALLIITISAFTLKRAETATAFTRESSIKNDKGIPTTLARSKTYILKMGKSILIDTLIRRIIRLQGLVPDKDITISYIGMRPGEKLDEVLYSTNSKLIKTHNPNILEIVERPEDLTVIEERVRELKATIDTYSAEDIRSMLESLTLLEKNS